MVWNGSEHVIIMASLRLARLLAPTSHFRSSPRLFSSSAPVSIRRSNLDEILTADTAFEALDDYYDDNDTASAGHLMLRQQRQVLYYLRLIEHEMPKLVGEQDIVLIYSTHPHDGQRIANLSTRRRTLHHSLFGSWTTLVRNTPQPQNA